MANARALKEGIEKTGRFDILSKDVGVPLVAFSLKDSSKYTVFEIADSLRKFGWIVPAYTMPADAEHVAVLRVVIREDFNHSLAERLIHDMVKIVEEIEALPPRVSNRVKKSEKETAEGVAAIWKKFVDGKKHNKVC